MTNDDVLGDEIPTDQQDAFRQFCYQTLKLGLGVSLLIFMHEFILCLRTHFWNYEFSVLITSLHLSIFIHLYYNKGNDSTLVFTLSLGPVSFCLSHWIIVLAIWCAWTCHYMISKVVILLVSLDLEVLLLLLLGVGHSWLLYYVHSSVFIFVCFSFLTSFVI